MDNDNKQEYERKLIGSKWWKSAQENKKNTKKFPPDKYKEARMTNPKKEIGKINMSFMLILSISFGLIIVTIVGLILGRAVEIKIINGELVIEVNID